MKNKDCYIIIDLLPLYIDDVVSNETRRFVDEHLSDCEECRMKYIEMKRDLIIPTDKNIQVMEANRLKKYFQKLRRKQIIGLIATILLTLISMICLYNFEFNIDISSATKLESAIEEYRFNDESEVNVLEYEKVDNRMFVLFENSTNPNEYGLAEMEKGIFGKYRFLNCYNTQSGVYTAELQENSFNDYLLVYAAKDYPQISSYEVVDVFNENKVLYSNKAEKAPFLQIVEMNIESTEASILNVFYYDIEGNEISEVELSGSNTSSTSSVTSMETGKVYVFMTIVFLLGAVFVNYFRK